MARMDEYLVEYLGKRHYHYKGESAAVESTDYLLLR